MTDGMGPWGMSAWQELRRRKVAQWSIAYAAAAWGVLQGLQFFTEVFGWPARTVRLATIACIVGFPVAVVLAWYHGDRGEQRVSVVEFAVLVALLLAGGGIFGWFAAERRTIATEDALGVARPIASSPSVVSDAGPRDHSIAVLPFLNMSDDPTNEYFADGLSEELLNLLTRIPELRVAARTSSFSFKGKDVDIGTIARQLNVGHVLEGSVRKDRDRVRITAQLIHADDGFHVWSDSYDRTLVDVFAVQDEIAAAVVDALKLRMLGVEQPSAVRTDPKAYALYLEGKQAIEEETAESRERGIRSLQRSLEIAPAYAPAWDQLARALRTQTWLGEIPLQEGFARVRAAVAKALEADPDYGPAHATMAALVADYDWNFVEAQRWLQSALTLAPTDAVVLFRAADFLITVGRTDQAIEVARRRLDRDPLNARALLGLAWSLYMGGRLEESRDVYRALLARNVALQSARSDLGDIYLLLGDPAAALEQYRQLSNDVNRESRLALAYARTGRTVEAKAILAELRRQHPDWAYVIAEGYAALGDPNAAFDALDRGLRERDPALKLLRVSHFLRPLHADPRWVRLLQTLGLADEQVAQLSLDVALP